MTIYKISLSILNIIYTSIYIYQLLSNSGLPLTKKTAQTCKLKTTVLLNNRKLFLTDIENKCLFYSSCQGHFLQISRWITLYFIDLLLLMFYALMIYYSLNPRLCRIKFKFFCCI